MIAYILALLAGTLYGLFIGIIPAAGATTGLVTLFPFLLMLQSIDPYLVVVFVMAVVASSTTGDTFASILLGIPGANSSAATMVDGFPLAQQGKAAFAMSAAITTSTVNGLLFGALTFFLLPWYQEFILLPPDKGGVGQAELFAFVIMAFVSVVFVANQYWLRSTIALALGIFFALVGVDPVTAEPRFTFGWEYLQGDGSGKGIPLIPVVAGLFAFPEMILAYKNRASRKKYTAGSMSQVWDGIRISFVEWKLALRGGIIGSVIGFLPGIGGAVSDWLSYGQTVATNPREKFGNGNIKGVIGPEGSNNAQKATSMIPTVLFGIPGAPFAAIIIALFASVGFDLSLDTAGILKDQEFFWALGFGFLAATLLTGIISLFLVKYIAKVVHIPYSWYFPFIIIAIVWAVYVSGFDIYGWQNVLMLFVFTGLGLIMRRWHFSRPALLIGFMLGDKIERLAMQTFELYNIAGYPFIQIKSWFGYSVGKGQLLIASQPSRDLLQHPTFVGILIVTLLIIIVGWKHRGKVDYS